MWKATLRESKPYSYTWEVFPGGAVLDLFRICAVAEDSPFKLFDFFFLNPSTFIIVCCCWILWNLKPLGLYLEILNNCNILESPHPVWIHTHSPGTEVPSATNTTAVTESFSPTVQPKWHARSPGRSQTDVLLNTQLTGDKGHHWLAATSTFNKLEYHQRQYPSLSSLGY